jgi:ribonucleoside-diphosphate reductase subunit M2
MSDSPVKKLNFGPTDKENAPLSSLATDATATQEKSVMEKPVVKEALKVAPGIKETEADEPLLQENPHRFVLFPIKYHEVSAPATRRA